MKNVSFPTNKFSNIFNMYNMILCYMGIVKKNDMKSYWSVDSVLLAPLHFQNPSPFFIDDSGAEFHAD